MNFPKTDRNRVKRVPNRGHYDRETIHAVLDAGFLCHAGFVVDDQPFVIPTLYGRDGDRIYLHGSAASRMLNVLAGGVPVCLTVTHVDGLVLARSAFHHSMNYRSAVVFGTATEVDDPQKEQALKTISDQVLRGRWDEVRAPNAKELKATSVLQVNIESASAKIRSGPPLDEPDDLELPIWAGVIPIERKYAGFLPDPELIDDVAVPDSVRALVEIDDA